MDAEERDSRLVRERARLAGLLHERYPDFAFELVPHEVTFVGEGGRRAATVLYRQGSTVADSCCVDDERLLAEGADRFATLMGTYMTDAAERLRTHLRARELGLSPFID